ncbi:hypothetical protein FJTKL_08059 [Diaporthe vaccinii]|uniref:Uncharacterized protein n=1 Tax=Diaporthe vaccinii TaxID=105482 RepID=A0ABR4FED1_9PEZI
MAWAPMIEWLMFRQESSIHSRTDAALLSILNANMTLDPLPSPKSPPFIPATNYQTPSLYSHLYEILVGSRFVNMIRLHLDRLLDLDLQPRPTPLVVVDLAPQHMALLARRRQAVYAGWNRAAYDGHVDFHHGPQGDRNAGHYTCDEQTGPSLFKLRIPLCIPDCSSYGPFKFWYSARSLMMDTMVVLPRS